MSITIVFSILAVVNLCLCMFSCSQIWFTFKHQDWLRDSVKLMGQEWVDAEIEWWDHNRQVWRVFAVATGFLTGFSIGLVVIHALR